ncbi:VWA domain-containing protein [Candidatus Uabimicrobium sp. HlEnr_7]|uniref:vWA domain-containing protein n=1 Tax=Candidatus Uabimicrobium helgolandensis TaxID=3095367 RepID=UPI003558570F
MKKQREISVFSISFIDVFCCALGAMILIFVINSQHLNNTVKSSVEKYRQKAAEAKQERNLARKSREEAQKARDLANQTRDIAESAEKDALRSKYLAEKASKEALEKAHAAQQAIQQAKTAQNQAQVATQKLRKTQIRSEIVNQDLQKKNQLLKEKNQALEAITQQKEISNKELQNLMAQYKKLQQLYDVSQKARKELRENATEVASQNKSLQERVSDSRQQKQIAQQQLDEINSASQKIADQNKTLISRLESKEQQLKDIEAQIKQREQEIEQKEDAIETLEETLKKKGDKSLFGIKLKYKRIVFLLDKSGSIISNHWKKVIIDTCEEVLQHCEVDEFAVVAFSSNMKFYPKSKGLMAAGDEQNKNNAVHWLKRKLRFGGSTYVHEALRIAYEDYGNLDAIFLLTDGLPYAPKQSSSDLQKQILDYIRKKQGSGSKTRIITIAIGYPPTEDGKKEKTQYADIYKYLHTLSELTNGQYVGR